MKSLTPSCPKLHRRVKKRLFSLFCVFLLLLLFLLKRKGHRQKQHSPRQYTVRESDIDFYKCASDTLLIPSTEDVMTVVPSEPFGRLGNVLLALIFAALEAHEGGCHLEFPSQLKSLPDWYSSCPLIVNLRPASVSEKLWKHRCGTRTFADFGRTVRHNRLLDPVATAFALDILSLYTGTDASHAYGQPCPETDSVAVHIRGGDLVSGYYDSSGIYHSSTNRAKNSGVSSRVPFATAYYLQALKEIHQHRPFLRTKIFFEDTFSPSFPFFEHLQVTGNTEVFVGRPLIHDIVDMACSSELVTSRGSFFYAAVLRYRYQRVHFQSDAIASEYRCHLPCQVQGHYLVNDTEYNGMLIHESWDNNAWQRDIINRDFIVRPSQCLPCTQSENCVL